MSEFIPGPPGIRYEATWARRFVRAAAFQGRVFEQGEGGGCELFTCTHKHVTQAEATGCAVSEARRIATREIANWCEIVAAMDPAALTASIQENIGLPVVWEPGSEDSEPDAGTGGPGRVTGV